MILKAIQPTKLRSISQNHKSGYENLILFNHENAKIALPIINGMLFIKLKDISFFKSDDVYATLHDVEGNKYFISKPLKWIEDRLRAAPFCRVHKSFLTNMFNVLQYQKNDGGLLVMECGSCVPISRRKRNVVCELLSM